MPVNTIAIMEQKSGRSFPHLPRLRRRESLASSLSAGACDSPGIKRKMEDAHRLQLPRCGYLENEHNPSKRTKVDRNDAVEPNISFFLVCDGHGGSQVADFVNSHLYEFITKQEDLETDTESAIARGILQMEDAVAELAKDETIDGGIGTTVTLALILGNTLYIANIGDSEAVICSGGKTQVLTDSHTPSNEKEIERIEKEGGVIFTNHKQKRLGHPVWNPAYVNLGVTRAIGDFYFKSEEWVGGKKSGLIAKPKIVKWNLTTNDEFLLIATDGFWDVIPHSEAVEFVKHCMYLDSNTICKALTQWGESKKSKDNITVLLVKFTSHSPFRTSIDSATPDSSCQSSKE